MARGRLCSAGSYETSSSTCALKLPGGVPAPLDTLSESLGGSRYDGCVSGQGDANNYCVAPVFGSGDCATTAQCATVRDNDGRETGCDPVNNTCSVAGCGAGSYVSADGQCHDKVASRGAAPYDPESGIAADGCVSGAEQGGLCAAPATGSGDCRSAAQCADVTTANASTLGCMINRHCGPTACAAGYYVTSAGTCSLKISATKAPLDTLAESVGGSRYDGCVSGQGDANNYCVTPAFGAGDCATTAQCAFVVDGDNRDAGCDPDIHTCSVAGCGAGSYVSADGRCHDKAASGNPAPTDTQTGSPADGCVSGSLQGMSCAATSTGSGDCWSADQCTGITTANASTLGCMLNRHCGPTACVTGYYVTSAGTCNLKLAGSTPAPLDTLAESVGGSRYEGCVSGQGDANNYCVPPASGAGDCASDVQCNGVVVAGAAAGQCTSGHCEVGACSAGLYVASGACVACTVCNLGERVAPACATAADTVCATCAPGTFAATTNAATCTMCPADTYALAGATSCTACETGAHSQPGSNACTQCATGSVYNGGACTTCAAGTFADDDATTCATCPAGTFAGAGATSCTACAPGASAAAGASSCVLCEPGTFAASAGASTCEVCPVGTRTPLPGSTACEACPAGQFVSGGACATCTMCGLGERRVQECTSAADTVCAPCTAGTFADVTDADACALCPADTFSASGASSCAPCAFGTHSEAGASACSRCEAGASYADGACTSCAPGTAAVDGVVCAPCAPGTSAIADGATSCTACAPGSHAALYGGSACTPCAAGTFAASAGESTCESCLAGTTSTAGATLCTACPDGMFALAGAQTCTACGDCDDGNACTSDVCDAQRGCIHTNTCGATQDPTSPQTTNVTGTGCASLRSEPEMLAMLFACFVVWRLRAR